jgi:hypothetical protein
MAISRRGVVELNGAAQGLIPVSVRRTRRIFGPSQITSPSVTVIVGLTRVVPR